MGHCLAQRTLHDELGRKVVVPDTIHRIIPLSPSLTDMVYAMGAGEDVVDEIAKSTGGKPKEVVNELLRRKLIRPLVTQGHIGDVLPDKIVYDAQTTSGGSGGPLINRDGEVIGVTFAVVKGFGGSNFGVPIRFAQPLLKP